MPFSASDVLLVDRRDGITTLTMNRPDSMNSLSSELKSALLDALINIRGDESTRAVILTGTGRGFCVGQDLAEHVELLRSGSPTPLQTVREHYNPITEALTNLRVPVIAAVNGTAAGAGAGFAFACDLRIVSNEAKFLLAFANVGLGLDSGASWTLPRLVGAGRAAELCLLAQPISAETADRYGLVTQLVPPNKVLSSAQELARRLASGPTAAYAGIKQTLLFSATHSLTESLENEAVQQNALGASVDHAAAVEAFVAKQPPVFTGR